MAPWSIICRVSFVVNNTRVSVSSVFWLPDSHLFYGRVQNMDLGTWTTPWTRSIDHLMDLVHGPGPWTTPNFQKEIPPVKMKIYRRSGFEKHRLIFFINMPCLQICVRRVNFVYKIDRLIFMHDRVQ